MRSLSIGLLALGAALSMTFTASADVKVGDQMPSLKFKEAVRNEYKVDLNDLQGYVVVVEFWATWCGPCKRSIPHLNEMHEKLKDKGVVIIGMSDEDPDTVKGFLKQMRMDYLVVAGSGSNRDFGVQAIPKAFVVDTEGVVRWIGNPLDPQFDKQVTSAVSKYQPQRRLGGGPEWAEKVIGRIETALEKHDYDSARADVRRLQDLGMWLSVPASDYSASDLEALAARAERVIKRLSTIAEADLKLAMQDIDAGRYTTAIESLRRIEQDFADAPIGKQASAVLKKLESDPKVMQARRNSLNEKLATNALKRAIQAKSDGHHKTAYLRLQAIVKRYGTTNAGAEAKSLIEAYEADETLMAEITGDGG